MRFFVVAIALWLGPVVSQTTVIPIFEVGPSDVFTNVRASVIGVDSSATTLLLHCLPNAPDSVCDIATPLTVTEGPSTFSLSGIYVATFTDHMVTVTETQDCKITGSVEAFCTASRLQEIVKSGSSTSSGYITQTTFTSGEFTYGPITVTAGVKKLQITQNLQTSTQTPTQTHTHTPTQTSTQTPTASAGQSAERLSGNDAVSLGGIIAVALAALL